MKKIMLLLLAVLIVGTASAQTNNNAHKESQMNKILVVYYSQTNNTRTAAEMLARELGADIARIESTTPYDMDMWKAWDEAQAERKDWDLRQLKNLPDLSAYSTILVGTPVWGYTLANPIFAFMRQSDFSGKRVFGFWTFYDHDEQCDADFKRESKGSYAKGLPLPRRLTGNKANYEKTVRSFAAEIKGR